MERQNSTATPTKPKHNQLASSPSNVSTTPASPQQRKKRKTNWVLFAILRCFAILGPIGFTLNIFYFQFYVQSSHTLPKNNGLKHPFEVITSSFHERADQHHRRKDTAEDERRITEKDDSSINSAVADENANGKESGSTKDRPVADEDEAVKKDSSAASDAEKIVTTPPIMSSMQVLSRMQSHSTAGWEACGKSAKSTVALTKRLQNEPQNNLRANGNKEGVLEPFALRLSIEEHLKELQHADADENTAAQQCWIPQRGTLDCDADSYSIIVTFEGQKNFRPLFMNLLAWLTYPYISDIVVLMPHADWATEQHTTMDAKYKERIKTWHADKNHKVFMIGLPNQIEEDPSSKHSFQTLLKKVMVRVKSDVVLFMDGSIIWDGNNRGLTAGFELWKQNTHGMVAAHKLHTGAPESMCQPSPGKLWTPFCESGASKLPADLDILHWQYQNILDLNGVFVHKGMLCLLGQDPLSSILRKNVWNTLDDKTDPQKTFAYTRAIVAIAMLQIAGGPPLLFPPTIARPSNETKDYNNNWHFLPHIREIEHFEEVTANNTVVQKKTLLSLLGYFGNALVANANEGDMAPYWCTAKKEVEGVFFITDIPWMEETKCKRVAADADVLKPIM